MSDHLADRVERATIGLRDDVHQQGSAVFVVRGEGFELYQASRLRPGLEEKQGGTNSPSASDRESVRLPASPKLNQPAPVTFPCHHGSLLKVSPNR